MFVRRRYEKSTETTVLILFSTATPFCNNYFRLARNMGLNGYYLSLSMPSDHFVHQKIDFVEVPKDVDEAEKDFVR